MSHHQDDNQRSHFNNDKSLIEINMGGRSVVIKIVPRLEYLRRS